MIVPIYTFLFYKKVRMKYMSMIVWIKLIPMISEGVVILGVVAFL